MGFEGNPQGPLYGLETGMGGRTYLQWLKVVMQGEDLEERTKITCVEMFGSRG